jgi:hypothetical protein
MAESAAAGPGGGPGREVGGAPEQGKKKEASRSRQLRRQVEQLRKQIQVFLDEVCLCLGVTPWMHKWAASCGCGSECRNAWKA